MADNAVANDSKILSAVGQRLTAISQNRSAAATMDNARVELGLIGQIVTSLSYTIKHQNVSSAALQSLPLSFSSTTGEEQQR